MPTTDENVTAPRCEKCDRETTHVIKLDAPDNSVRYVCWSCFSRGEKRFNVKDSWRRQARGREFR
ncbi:MAG TPA: hypothetical protein VNA19_02280 [Pyrinomonadaceae bacterium]|jgi:lysyl-tRNA synthetase class I|nr:hypothetical protein [Pyrinomonadaceae bacterium]